MATQFANGKIVTDGLVLALNAADRNSYPGSGTTWIDITGRGSNLTLYNGPTFSSSNGGTLVFDAVDDYARVSSPNITLGTSARTLMGWFKATTSVYGCIFGFGNSPSTSTYGSFELWNYADPLSIHFAGGSISSGFNLSTNTNKWIMVVMTFDGTTAIISITCDGVVYTGSSTVPLNTSTGNFSVNKSAYGSEGGGLAGSWASILTYNRVLSSAEVTQNYNAIKSRLGLK